MGQSDVLNKLNSNETRNNSKLAVYSWRTKENENHIELDLLNAIKGTTHMLEAAWCKKFKCSTHMLEDCCGRSRTNWSHNPLAHQHQIAWTLKKSLYLKLSHSRFDVNVWPLIRTGVFIDDSTIRSWVEAPPCNFSWNKFTQPTNRKHNMLSNHFENLSPNFSSTIVVRILTNKMWVVEIFLTKNLGWTTCCLPQLQKKKLRA